MQLNEQNKNFMKHSKYKNKILVASILFALLITIIAGFYFTKIKTKKIVDDSPRIFSGQITYCQGLPDICINYSERLCHHIGSYCKSRRYFIGKCSEKVEVHCCFESNARRVVSEQAKLQLGINWGTPKLPNCGGLTLEEFKKTDFANADFTELLPVNQSKTNSLLEISRQIREAICTGMTSKVLIFLQNKNLTKEDIKGVYKRIKDGCSKIEELTDLEQQYISDK